MLSTLASDRELIAVVSGEKAAWDSFAEKCAGLIFSVAKRVLQMKTGRAQPDDARDIAQDVFVRLVKNDFKLLRTYNPEKASLSTWLTVVTRSTAIDYLRASAKHSVLEALGDDIAGEPDKPFGRGLDLPPDLLSDRQHQVVRMLYHDDMDVAEVADTLHIGAQTVRSLKHKALTKLRSHYGLR